MYNLGDIVGYGPNPLECIDLALRMSVSLMGNWDHATLSYPDGFCTSAEQSVWWTKAQLATADDLETRGLRVRFLNGLRRTWRESHRGRNVLFVHGSPRNPLNEYIFPEDVCNSEKLRRIWAKFESICFCGHTHIPGIFRETEPGAWEYLCAEDCAAGFSVAGQKFICNVGSVGQPRDGDERACYALFDGDRVWFRFVEYDIETTVRKIYAVPELANFLGDRLWEGR